jgi:hypothetical protein
LAASIQLGQFVEYHWKWRDEAHAKKIGINDFDFTIISETDKQYVRVKVVERMF